MVNAQRFRARKVDLKRPLPVFRAADLEDLEDDDNRHVDAIETGVEKEEEAEHHLQAAISSTHAAASGEAPSKQVYIPTPDASKVIDAYDELYLKNFTCPTSLIRSSETVEECCAPLYCMDDEDAEWLAAFNARRAKADQPAMSEDQFELGMDQLETLTRDMVFLRPEDFPSAEYLASHAADRDRPFARATVDQVFEHWKQRRIDSSYKPVIPALQYEDTSKTEIDPYVCFRRREVRQGRKTRRADQRSLEQLRRLRVNLAMAAQMLEMCLERETAKIEIIAEAQTVARQRGTVLRMRRRLGVTTASDFDDLFVPPMQQRKRMAARDPSQQRPRASAVRKPRIASGLASAAAAAAAAAGGNGAGSASGSGIFDGLLGDLLMPQPYALPRSISVPQYPVPQRLVDMGERIHARSTAYDARLANGWVDATFAGPAMNLHTNRVIDPLAASFWSPHMTAEAHAHAPTAFRMRSGRLGRLFLDRRTVRAHSVPEDRLQKYRMGLLSPEDRVRLLTRTIGDAADSSGASSTSSASSNVSSMGIPEELLRPFSFAVDLLPPMPPPMQPVPLPMPLVVPVAASLSSPTSCASSLTMAGMHVPPSLNATQAAAMANSATSLLQAMPGGGGSGSPMDISSPPLSAGTNSSIPDLSAAPTPTNLLAMGRFRPPHTPMTAVDTDDDSSQHSPLMAIADTGRRLDYLHPAPLTLHKSNSMTAAMPGAPQLSRGISSAPSTAVAPMHYHRFDSSSPPKTHITTINIPALVSTVSSPALVSISPQLGSGPPPPISNAAK
ncbi:Enhancer of polycomb-like protein 1 [Coemansia aciculifera]|uniref:Enhancer of polycomb-like protein n=1 Tax=Coemansia aciculifera TaxID=417176 RepID=A0A9W8M3R5_9FUNG|nr:Enhancer of polycomb-like protein 1 [Coemansia aciculifera]KAJ2872191.1 Enhancer of polycomb-like protein 1 [Coemansia aciculifera]KAJ2882270.1 Enhancer of polycomb-like protein 1 [Coemansia aciculifera]